MKISKKEHVLFLPLYIGIGGLLLAIIASIIASIIKIQITTFNESGIEGLLSLYFVLGFFFWSAFAVIYLFAKLGE